MLSIHILLSLASVIAIVLVPLLTVVFLYGAADGDEFAQGAIAALLAFIVLMFALTYVETFEPFTGQMQQPDTTTVQVEEAPHE